MKNTVGIKLIGHIARFAPLFTSDEEVTYLFMLQESPSTYQYLHRVSKDQFVCMTKLGDQVEIEFYDRGADHIFVEYFKNLSINKDRNVLIDS